MNQCRGITRGGDRCSKRAESANGFCYLHDPAHANKRRVAASRAGKSRPSREIVDLKRQLEELAGDVREGKIARSDAAVINQIVNTRVRLIETERKIREEEEIVARLDALERGGQGWRGA